jgi:2-dehydropantoate 2-reductase
MFGAGVIGGVYGERLLAAGHDVVLLARGGRLRDLRESGLVLRNAQTG